jgi:hypothetical protein
MVHNKTLAAQLYMEFRRLFPENTVEYFVSYYDYYQPEAYGALATPRNRAPRGWRLRRAAWQRRIDA